MLFLSVDNDRCRFTKHRRRATPRIKLVMAT
jgi:hypothetical protein